MGENKKSTTDVLEEILANDTVKKAYIYTGGGICKENIHRTPEKEDLVIAADSGLENARLLGVRIGVAVGDFDSANEMLVPEDAERITVPAEKDFTDTMLAISVAVERGAKQIIIIGGLDGRLDHTLSNLYMLEALDKKRIFATIEDGRNRVRYMSGTSTLIAAGEYKYLSVIAADKKVKGVCIEGCKYPLKNATLLRDDPFAVSNEIVGNVALVSVRKGGVFIVESNDLSAAGV